MVPNFWGNSSFINIDNNTYINCKLRRAGYLNVDALFPVTVSALFK